jgi:hypothetical protein
MTLLLVFERCRQHHVAVIDEEGLRIEVFRDDRQKWSVLVGNFRPFRHRRPSCP